MMMIDQALRKITPLVLAASALSLASCALPPDEAWSRIKQEGLLPYIADSIAHPGVMPDPANRVTPTEAPASTPTATPPAKTSTSAIVSTTPAHTTTSAPAAVASTTAPKSTPVAKAPASGSTFSNVPASEKEDHPMVAKSVPSLPGFVRSPYTNPPRLVDAKGATPGSTLICPYTQKPFIVPNDFAGPSSSVASSTPAPKAPAPVTTPHPSTPPPSVAKNDVPPQTPAGSLFSNAPQKNAPTPPATPAVGARDIPYGVPIPGRPGFVNSPFAAKHQLVDVTGLPPGMEVKCPYTGKLFRVPSADVVEQKDKTSNIAAPENPQKK
jgi:hypothetical protein